MTAAPVRIARVLVPLGVRFAEIVTAPELVLAKCPIRKVPVLNRLISPEVSDKLPAVSVPRFIGVLVVVGEIVITPVGAESV